MDPKGISRPKGIALDSEYIYWAQAGEEFSNEGAIGRAEKRDGGESMPEFVPSNEGTERPRGAGGGSEHIYWTMNNSSVSGRNSCGRTG